MNESTNGKSKIIVGIGEVCVRTGNSELIAFAVGSCIALCLYDPCAKVGAMAHILLPSASFTGRKKAPEFSTRFADHALHMALKQMELVDADRHSIVAAIVGGAGMFPHGNVKVLNIGQMNIRSVTQELQKMAIPLVYQDTGGHKSRTVTFSIPGNGFDQQLQIRSGALSFSQQFDAAARS